MKYTSLFEKLNCLFKLIASSYVYIGFLILIVLLLALFLLKKIKKNKFILSVLILYLALFAFIVINNFNCLGKILDSIMTNFFTNIYFPSVYVYFFVLAMVDIMTIISLFNIKMSNIYKIVNLVCFAIVQFIFVIVMEIVSKNNVDIFSKTSLFTNVNLVTMLELSINVFIAWIITLGSIYLINVITLRILANKTEKDLQTLPTIINNDLGEVTVNSDLDAEYLANDEVSYNEAVLENVNNDMFNLNDLVYKSNMELDPSEEVVDVKEDNDDIVQVNTSEQLNKFDKDMVINNEVDEVKDNVVEVNNSEVNSMFDMLLNNTLPLINTSSLEEVKEVKEVKKEKVASDYTLEDYKIFNKMLKEIKMYNIGSIVNIDRVMELRLLDKFSNDEYNLFKKMLKSYSN